jgi:hypothetical protein
MPDGQFWARAIRLRTKNGASAAPAIIERRVIRINSSASFQIFGGLRAADGLNHTARRQYRWPDTNYKLVFTRLQDVDARTRPGMTIELKRNKL